MAFFAASSRHASTGSDSRWRRRPPLLSGTPGPSATQCSRSGAGPVRLAQQRPTPPAAGRSWRAPRDPPAQQCLAHPGLSSDPYDRPAGVDQMRGLTAMGRGVVLPIPRTPTCRHPLRETHRSAIKVSVKQGERQANQDWLAAELRLAPLTVSRILRRHHFPPAGRVQSHHWLDPGIAIDGHARSGCDRPCSWSRGREDSLPPGFR